MRTRTVFQCSEAAKREVEVALTKRPERDQFSFSDFDFDFDFEFNLINRRFLCFVLRLCLRVRPEQPGPVTAPRVAAEASKLSVLASRPAPAPLPPPPRD